MKILIDADDAALDLKEEIINHLQSGGFDVQDLCFGSESTLEAEPCYPDIAYNLAVKIQAGEAHRGILLCGTGIGMAITANKVKGVYACTAHDTYSAQRLRKSNDANVLTMGSRVVGIELAKCIVDDWLSSEFAGGGSTYKVSRIRALEAESFDTA